MKAGFTVRAFRMVIGVAGICTIASAGAAQTRTGVEDGGPDPGSVRVRMGPLWMTPRLELKNIGVDTNVFNEPDDQNPKQDFTITLTPAMDVWLGMGRSWLKFTAAEDLVWYNQYTTQRSANEHFDLSWRMPINRVAFTISPTYVSTNERPGFEIDARVHHSEWGGKAQVDVHALAKTSFGIMGSYKDIRFDDASYQGSNLHDELSRTETIGGFSVRHDLTPLTAIVVSVEQQQDRFQYQPLRDTDSTRIGATVSFDPHALLKGSASFGYRDFHPVDGSVPGFNGFTTVGDLSYTLLGTTRFQVQFKRDVQYSYDINQPYYLESGVDGSIAQQIFGPIDAVVRAGLTSLAYQDRTGAAVAVADRVDDNHMYGGGIGYHFSNGLRVGFNVDYYRRTSDLEQRRYSGLKYGASATYEF